MRSILTFILIVFVVGHIGCTTLHSTQLGNIDSVGVLKGERFEILISEVGTNLEEATAVAAGLATLADGAEQAKAVGGIIALFQMGPRTGNPVFDETYSDSLFSIIKSKCPNGSITGLSSIRESAKYPILSGEIVRLVGYCQKATLKP